LASSTAAFEMSDSVENPEFFAHMWHLIRGYLAHK
jgi:hypothetical protein